MQNHRLMAAAVLLALSVSFSLRAETASAPAPTGAPDAATEATSKPAAVADSPAQPPAPNSAETPPFNEVVTLEEIRTLMNLCKPLAVQADKAACYDKVLALLSMSAEEIVRAEAADPAVPPAGRYGAPIVDEQGRIKTSGNWLVLRENDSMTDAPRVTLVIAGKAEIGGGNGDASMAFRCFRGAFEVFLIPGSYIGTRSTFPATFRFDAGAPINERWNASSNGTGLFGPNPKDTFARLSTSTRFLIEVQDFQSSRHRISFDLIGIKDVASSVEACTRPAPQRQQPRR